MPTMTHWRRELRGHADCMLATLGDDAGEVARRLEDAGVRGTPGDPRDCAIAVYLSAVVAADPRVRSLRVMSQRVVISPTRWGHPPIVVELSDALRAFVVAFDRRAYPTIVRPERPARPSRRGVPQASP